jgi:hypothetical protein
LIKKQTFLLKHLQVSKICYTFAIAFASKRTAIKLLEIGVKKEFFEKIYIDREVVQEASAEFTWYSGKK